MVDASSSATMRPRVVVAHKHKRGVIGLGLDRPLDLLGHSTPVDGIGMDFGIPFAVMNYQEDLDLLVDRDTQRHLRAQDGWWGMPPTLMLGPPGVGRAFQVRALSRHSGIPRSVVDIGGKEGFAQLTKVRRGEKKRFASNPVMAMSFGQCANPIILVVGTETADPKTLDTLASMIDPSSNSGWHDDHLGVDVDLSRITWLIQAYTPGHLPAALLDVVRPVELVMPTSEWVDPIITMICLEAFDDLGIDGRELRYLTPQFMSDMRKTWKVCRSVRAIYDAVIGNFTVRFLSGG